MTPIREDPKGVVAADTVYIRRQNLTRAEAAYIIERLKELLDHGISLPRLLEELEMAVCRVRKKIELEMSFGDV